MHQKILITKDGEAIIRGPKAQEARTAGSSLCLTCITVKQKLLVWVLVPLVTKVDDEASAIISADALGVFC